MRTMGVVFTDAGSPRRWLMWMQDQNDFSGARWFSNHLLALCPVDTVVIEAGKEAAQYAPTPEERGRLTAKFVKALQSNAQV